MQHRAPKKEIVDSLGTNYLMYSKGATTWDDLTNVLAREPTNRLVAVRIRVPKWPKVMLYSTPDVMTWVFLDEGERAVDFVVGAQ